MQNKGFIKGTDFWSAIKPLLYTSKIIGIAPFHSPYWWIGENSGQNGYTSTSAWATAQSLILILGLSCAFIPHLKFKVTHVRISSSFSFVIFDVVGSVLMFLASAFSFLQQGILYRGELKEALLTVSQIDTHLLRKSYSNVYKNTKIILITQLIFCFAYFLSLFSFDFISRRESFGWFHCFVKYTINIVDVVMNLQFVNFVFLIGHRFKVLNMELNSTITSHIRIDDHVSSTEDHCNISILELELERTIRNEKRASRIVADGSVTNTQNFTNNWLKRRLKNQKVPCIRTLRRIYLSLHAVITTVNNSFGIQIMLTIISSATAATLNIHISIVLLTKDLETPVKDMMGKFLTLSLAWTVPAVLRLIVITASCEMSKKESARTAVVVQKLLLHRHLNPDVSEELQLFSQQILHVDTNFTASGFFTLDFRFLYSTLGSMATFLVFLTQVWESYDHHLHINI
jgi:hypothetical protein